MIVFHYTDIENLDQILSTTSKGNQHLVLKAKHRCYLQDDSQRTFGRYLLPSCIEAIEADLEIEPVMTVSSLIKDPQYIQYILDSVNTYNDHRQGIESFVLSFSEDQDNVELWEKSGNAGRGVALGFDTDKLQPDYKRFVNVFSDRCTYWSDQIKDRDYRLDKNSKLYAGIKRVYQMMSDPRVIESFSVIYGQENPQTQILQRIKDTLVSNIITTFDVFNKQHTYRNEKEYRMSLGAMPVEIEFVKDPEGDYIPFANVAIPVAALRMMVIGRKCGKNAYGMIKSLLMQKGISQDISIINSQVKD